MLDISILDALREEIQHRKQEVVSMLQSRYSDEQIKDLCSRLINAPDDSPENHLQQQLAKDHPPETYYAVVSLCCLMHLEKNIPPKTDYVLSAESAADLVLTGFNAMLTLVEAGWKPSELFAMTRLKQIQNQPKKRSRDNKEREDIDDYLSGYVERYKHAPSSFEIFLNYLGSNGLVIDNANRTVDRIGEWKRCKSFKTVGVWWRTFKKDFEAK